MKSKNFRLEEFLMLFGHFFKFASVHDNFSLLKRHQCVVTKISVGKNEGMSYRLFVINL